MHRTPLCIHMPRLFKWCKNIRIWWTNRLIKSFGWIFFDFSSLSLCVCACVQLKWMKSIWLRMCDYFKGQIPQNAGRLFLTSNWWDKADRAHTAKDDFGYFWYVCHDYHSRKVHVWMGYEGNVFKPIGLPVTFPWFWISNMKMSKSMQPKIGIES